MTGTDAPLTDAGESRVEAVRRLLDREGVRGAVTAEGTDGDIAAIVAPAECRERLAVLAPEIRSLGFRYVALEPREAIEEKRDS